MSGAVDPFVHLHVHTDRSVLDGHSTIPEVVKEAARLGQPALAKTDHGSLGGIYQFWKECNNNGIKPIVGCEFYFAPDSRTTKEPVYWGGPLQRSDDISGQGAYTHITVVATSSEGIRNLFRLQATAYADGFYRKPRIDLDSLAAYSRGLVVTSGCAGSAISTRLRLGQYDEGQEMVGTFRSIFGDNFYIEIMRHDNPVDDIINPLLIGISKKTETPVVATNDTHYTTIEDAYAHDALLCLQTGQRLNGNRTFKFEGSHYHLRSYNEMVSAFPEEKAALQATVDIAERIESYDEFFAHRLRMPKISDDAAGDIKRLLDEAGYSSDAERQRCQYELETIVTLGFPDYFLVMKRIAEIAKERNIRVGPGRGSAGGSQVAYKLGITQLDAIEHGLLFERFLNPDRISLPDIDVDIDDTRRDELIEAIREEFGTDVVAQIGTYGTIKSKSALHDSARVLGFPRKISNDLTYRLPPPKSGRIPTLDEGSWDNLTDDQNKVLSLARSLEGRTRNQGIHPAGVVISPETLTDILPLYKPRGLGIWITEYDMNEVEDIGLVKMDYLGLTTLGIIDECLRMLSRRNERVELSTAVADLEDRDVYELLQSGNTLGVFQLDSPGMQQLLRSIKPTTFADISAVLALYRPGPMGANAHHSYAKRKNGAERVSYPHPELERDVVDILGDTYGLIVYQEQVMQLAQRVAGYTLAQADLLRRAMGKKKKEILEEEFVPFAEGMRANGYSEECIQTLWDTLVPFADYAFNKSHSAGYGIISYWTAMLKAKAPVEYMAAVLSKEDDAEDAKIYLQETARMGIPVLPPDINISEANWTPDGNSIRYGLVSIKGLGAAVYADIAKRRPFTSLDDFFRRASAKMLNMNALGALIQGGALDSLCPYREELFVDAEHLAARAQSEKKLANKGQRPLYSLPYTVSPRGLYDRRKRQKWERDVLSTTLTGRQIIIKANRWLEENYFYYLRNLTQQHPGQQRLQLRLGRSIITVGFVDWNDKLQTQLEATGVFTIEKD